MKKHYILLFALLSINLANAQWQQTSLDSGWVMCLAINGNNIFAGTQGNGVYLSSNNGNSWAAMGLTGYVVKAIAISGNNIFAGTDQGGGVFLFTNNGSSCSL